MELFGGDLLGLALAVSLPAGEKGRAVFGDVLGAPASCRLGASPGIFPRRKKETWVGSWIGFMLLP